MPTYRSISISLISQFDILTIPEFLPPKDRTSQTSNTSIDASSSDRATSEDPENSVVSVYVPAYPRSQFWISYSIAPPYPPKGLFYFKLFLNGAHVVSWGVSEKENYAGKTMFGLFNSTCGPLGYADLEKRAFCFGNPVVREEVAQDVLEIRIFRSKGRKRRERIVQDVQAVMDGIRKELGDESLSPDRQGIRLPNAGIVEEEHPQQFYQYALIDPLDQPFATFRYYPRSLDQLLELGVLSVRQDHEVSPSIENTQSDSSTTDRPSCEREAETSVRDVVESTTALWASVDRALQTNPVEFALTSPTPYSISRMSDPPAATAPSPSPDFRDSSLSRRYASAYDRQRWTPSPHKHDDRAEMVPFSAPTGHRAIVRPTAGSLRELVSSALRRRSADTQ